MNCNTCSGLEHVGNRVPWCKILEEETNCLSPRCREYKTECLSDRDPSRPAVIKLISRDQEPKVSLRITAMQGSISISGDFFYSCMLDMYEIDGQARDGEGIQVDAGTDEDKAKTLCRAISKAIKAYLK